MCGVLPCLFCQGFCLIYLYMSAGMYACECERLWVWAPMVLDFLEQNMDSGNQSHLWRDPGAKLRSRLVRQASDPLSRVTSPASIYTKAGKPPSHNEIQTSLSFKMWCAVIRRHDCVWRGEKQKLLETWEVTDIPSLKLGGAAIYANYVMFVYRSHMFCRHHFCVSVSYLIKTEL